MLNPVLGNQENDRIRSLRSPHFFHLSSYFKSLAFEIWPIKISTWSFPSVMACSCNQTLHFPDGYLTISLVNSHFLLNRLSLSRVYPFISSLFSLPLKKQNDFIFMASIIKYIQIFFISIFLAHNSPSTFYLFLQSYLCKHSLWNSDLTRAKLVIITPNKPSLLDLYFSPMNIIVLKSQSQSFPFIYLPSYIS